MTDDSPIVLAASVLLANGQTTERIVNAIEQLAAGLGLKATVIPRWGELLIAFAGTNAPPQQVIPAAPTGVDMRKVAAAMAAIEDFHSGQLDAEALAAKLRAARDLPPVSLARFAVFAALGAAALGVIFGVADMLNLALIAGVAGGGAVLRRLASRYSTNAFLQPFCAALLAGLADVVATDLHVSSPIRLIAVCPCMVLVPGPHVLNGMIDLLRSRLALGAGRLLFAGLIILSICTGLLLGLAFGGTGLTSPAASSPVAFGYDMLAAGIAVAAYATFFNMPYATLPVPMAVGMAAHGLRWLLIERAGASVETGALVACLLVGTIFTPLANRLRMPFAALAFASVVSLIPGVYLFRMASGLVDIAKLGERASPEAVVVTISDGITAVMIVMAISLGLIVPRMVVGRVAEAWSSRGHGTSQQR